MPINIPDSLPAAFALRDENIFYSTSSQAEVQDIRELRILILNLMPKKIETELHLLRMLSNSPLQTHIELLRIDDKPSKNTPVSHMETFYKDFDAIKDDHFDGMIITGAPLGQVPFSEVTFWDPLCEILEWTETNVTSTMFLCWAVQAAMFHLYGKDKAVLPEKLSGVYPHRLLKPLSPIVRGFDHEFQAPHSRYAEVPIQAIESVPELEILAVSEQAGPTYLPTRAASIYSSPGIQSTSLIRSKTNTCETLKPERTLGFLTTISETTIQPTTQS